MWRVDDFFATVGDVLGQIWTAATTPVDPPDQTVVLAVALVALAVVVVGPVWRVARHVVTIAHEGAHAVVAMLTGRRLDGIRLHSDTSGLTVTAGRPRGLGMVLTAFAGYVGPGLVGLGAAWLLRAGYAVGLLWLLVALLALLLLKIRNWFGLWSVLVSGAALVGVSWWLEPATQSAVAYAVTWFLLLGAVRPVLELQAQRARGRARSSDADQLGRLTGVPGILWVVVFGLVTLGCLVLGAGWIVGPVAA
ncbi:peptidase M50B-like protein [Isoptericola sp. CG 20/1183]|uniref:Peptidase M50B-like protein n=1 Tax=Isoptericola halotolerans TaxID=300560 RepID=A0ABX5EKJ5_9MICO|nr:MULTISPECIES: M50 family metallopeptidase [Isoptericola]MCK0118227.1 M50 family metallopeptidase [Isoptericola sp. S6320L]PRZ09445.1 peptidase M50B-like protein [Isoptericola sp. CG 20/1183]PRZ10246.1 peptidase M50B-like protein [Isoptericola halotolerans]